jgi:small subunit ribosomal protein S2
MKPYIFKRRNLIHIIDLRATLRGLITARELAGAVAASGQYILFVGTKKQARDLIAREAHRCGMPFVSERWPGGLLTNFVTIRQRLDRLEELEGLETSGEIELHSKKMISSLRRQKRRILRNLGGVRGMDRLPGLLIVVDPRRERIAVREAAKLGIPVAALTDTDGDPDELDVVVPGNDDSIGAIEIFLTTTSEIIAKARLGRPGPAEEPASPPPAAPEQAGAVLEPEAEAPTEEVAAEPAADTPPQEAAAELETPAAEKADPAAEGGSA